MWQRGKSDCNALFCHNNVLETHPKFLLRPETFDYKSPLGEILEYMLEQIKFLSNNLHLHQRVSYQRNVLYGFLTVKSIERATETSKYG